MPVEVADLKLYDLEELAKILKVTKVTLRSYIEQGRLEAVKVGRTYRISEEALKEFLLRPRVSKKKEEGKTLRKIPQGHLGKIKKKAFLRKDLYQEYLESKMESLK